MSSKKLATAGSAVMQRLFLACALWPCMAVAGTLFVASDGRDENSGTTPLEPLRNLSKAASLAKPGMDVVVAGGIYPGPVVINQSGKEAAYIRFHAAAGQKVIIDGSTMSHESPVVTINSSYVEFRGFEIRNSAGGQGVSVWCAHHDRIIDNTMHDTFKAGIFVGCDNPGVSGAHTVRGNTVFHTGAMNRARIVNAGWPQGITVKLTDDSLVANNVVFENYGEGIGPQQSRNTTITGNTLHDNYSVQIYIDNAPLTKVIGNFIYNTGNASFLSKGQQAIAIGAAIERVPNQLPLSGLVVANNITNAGRYGFYYGGFGHGGGVQDSVIANNTFANVVEAAVRIDPDSHSGNLYQNNVHASSEAGVLSMGSARGWSMDYNSWSGGAVAAEFVGQHDLQADPMLTQPGAKSAEGYRIAANSPVASSGAAIAAIKFDYWGKPRITPYSMGAHQR